MSLPITDFYLVTEELKLLKLGEIRTVEGEKTFELMYKESNDDDVNTFNRIVGELTIKWSSGYPDYLEANTVQGRVYRISATHGSTMFYVLRTVGDVNQFLVYFTPSPRYTESPFVEIFNRSAVESTQRSVGEFTYSIPERKVGEESRHKTAMGIIEFDDKFIAGGFSFGVPAPQ